MSNASSGSSLTAEDWTRLYNRVFPNALTLLAFKAALVNGTLDKCYNSIEVRKVVNELRDILREHGALRQATMVTVSGKKADMAHTASKAVLVLDQLMAEAQLQPTVGTTSERAPSPNIIVDTTPTVLSAQEKPRSRPHLCNTNVDEMLAPLQVSTVPARTVAAEATTPPHGPHEPPPPHGRLFAGNSHVIAQHVAAAVAPAAPHPSPALPPPLHTVERAPTETEVQLLNVNASPFIRIVGIVKRFHLRFGSYPFRFDVPVQYESAIASRRLRLCIVPFRHPNIPAAWPTAKEIVIYVNQQYVTASWKRNWPARRRDVSRTYLPLDITQHLQKSTHHQALQLDVFNKDYFTPAMLAVVQPLTLEEVMEKALLFSITDASFTLSDCRCVLANADVTKNDASESESLRVVLMSYPTIMRSLLEAQHDNYVFYARVMNQEIDEDLEEADDPVITTKCPISQTTVEIPVRGRSCDHLQCVDMASFLISASKGSYWNCPLCDEEMRVQDLRIDFVLWKHLLGKKCTPYLRLTQQGGADTPMDEAYVWHPSNKSGGLADVDVEESPSRSDTDADDGAPERRMPSMQDNPASPVAPADHANLSLPTGNNTSRKRVREEKGTAEDPIEL